MAETKAMLYGLTWCADKGYSRVKGETDSLLLTKCISREWKIPWKMVEDVAKIHKLVKDHGFSIIHCYREANKPEDKLAIFSYQVNGSMSFTSFRELPRHVRGLVNMDKWGLPSIRSKQINNANYIDRKSVV